MGSQGIKGINGVKLDFEINTKSIGSDPIERDRPNDKITKRPLEPQATELL